MNNLIIIGNLTRDPETRDVDSETTCCTFTVAVNRRVRKGQHPQADYFRVTAWRQLGEICQQYLAKGRKVAVEGPVKAHAYTDSNGQARASLEVTAENVEFLTPRGQATAADDNYMPPSDDDYAEADDDDLPFN